MSTCPVDTLPTRVLSDSQHDLFVHLRDVRGISDRIASECTRLLFKDQARKVVNALRKKEEAVDARTPMAGK